LFLSDSANFQLHHPRLFHFTCSCTFPRGFEKALLQALHEAEQQVEECRQKKKEQEELAKQELEQAIHAAAKAFSVPIIPDLVDPSRKLGNDFE